jgi:WD40 repeat protein
MTRSLCFVAIFVAATSAPAAPPAVSAVAYHPKGKVAAFGTHGEVRLFDIAKGTETGRLTGQQGRVTAIAFDAAGKSLAVASGAPGKSGIVKVYRLDPQSKADAGQPATISGPKDAIYALAFSPDGKLVATAGYDRVIRLWTIPRSGDAAPVRELKDHSDTVYGLAFHPDGKLLTSVSADRAVKVWDIDTGTRLYTLGDATDWLYAVAWSPDGKHLAAAGADKSIRIWEANRDGGKLVHSVFAHEKSVWRIGYTADGKTLYSAGEDRVIKAWDAAKMVETKVFPAQPDTILDFAVRRDGKQLAVGLFDGHGLFLDTATTKAIAQALPVKPVPPKAAKLMPNAIARGQSVKLIITGKDLDHAAKATASLPTVHVKLLADRATPGQAEIEVTVPANARAGAVELTLEGEAGKSAPLTLAIDRHDAIAEPSTSSAMPVQLPATIAGSIDRAGDIDQFRFDAKAGDQIGVQIVAKEIGSKLDPVLTLTDAAGQILAEGSTLIGYTVPKAGTYSLAIRDRDYRGAADMTYRLNLGDVPVVTGVFPLAVQRGKIATVHVNGVNLGTATGLAVKVPVPADAKIGSRIPVPMPKGEEKPLGEASVVVEEFPAVVVDPSGGTEVRVPGSADGILLKPGQAQIVRFAAKKGQKLIIETNADRLGSPVDPVIDILDSAGQPVPRATLRSTTSTSVAFRDHDSQKPGIRLVTWNDLAIDDYLYIDGELMRILALPRNPDDDCQFYQVGGKRLGFLDTTPTFHSQDSPMYRVEIHPPGRTFPPNGLPVFTLYHRNDDGGPGYGKDSLVFFEAPEDGTYQARIADTRGAGGPNHAYRVTVRPPRPDFEIEFKPASPAVWKGGALPITVTATRLDGFDGPIRVKLDGLPPGFTAPETFIEKGQTTTSFALAAEDLTPQPPSLRGKGESGSPRLLGEGRGEGLIAAPTKLRLIATADINGKTVTHEDVGGIPKLIEPGDIVTTARQSEVLIRPGQETRLVVDIDRRNKFKGRVPLDVRGLPHGVRVLNIGLNGILITEREASREIVLYAEPWVKPMERPIVVLARREGKNTEHAAKSVLLRVAAP